MDLNDMLKEQQLWLNKAQQSLTAARAMNDTPADLKQPRIDYIKARIAELTQQKEREVTRYDAAIADLNSELAGLTSKPPPDKGAPPPKGTPPQATEAVKARPKARAKAKK